MKCVIFDFSKIDLIERGKWDKWVIKSQKATRELIAQKAKGIPLEFNPAIWSELKEWLLNNIYNGRCGYCESELRITTFGDADHYRPKGRVNSEPEHPGYYWVVYDWHNLVPCCEKCNRESKRDFFPISGRRVFSESEALDTHSLNAIEKPLLIHPCEINEDSPREHLTFDRYGYVIAKNGSERGQHTISICNLNRENLKNARWKQQEDAWREYCIKCVEMPRNDDDVITHERELKKLKEKLTTSTQYSAAVADYFKLRKGKI
jgi:uncharacterized protein (TIGR02646 family)